MGIGRVWKSSIKTTKPLSIDVVLINDSKPAAQTKNHKAAIHQIHPICMSDALRTLYGELFLHYDNPGADSLDLLWVIVYPSILHTDRKHTYSPVSSVTSLCN